MSEEDTQKEELFCHKDASRRCGPDCVAYQDITEDMKGYPPNSYWLHCVELFSSYRQAKHLVVLASDINALRKHADEAKRLGGTSGYNR